MPSLVNSSRPETSLRSKIKFYKKRIAEIKNHLDKRPQEWGRFQSEFNQEINGIFRDLMVFEKENVQRGDENLVYKLKMFFIEWFRDDFVKGKYMKHSLAKPYGYAGDFEIIDMIYQNNPISQGLDRLYDNYFQMSTICVAVRNRKEDFKRIIEKFVRERPGRALKIMDLASGPCRDVFELLSGPLAENQEVEFHCYDSDAKALQYARQFLKKNVNVKFYEQNAVRIALMKDVQSKINHTYDLIYSTGLFDYLDYRVSSRLVSNLKNLLNANGVLAIADVHEKFSNPSIYFMEWAADWYLIYRPADEFRQIFLDAGFVRQALNFQFEQQGIMQYVIAAKNGR